MKKQLLSRKRLTTLFYSLFMILLYINVGWGQTATDGDYRTAKATGNWSDADMWETRTAGTWAVTAVAPSATNNVYIQMGNIVTVDVASANCKDLQLNITGTLAIGTNIVNVNGKIRAWAYGFATATASSTAGIATIITSAPHGFSTGDSVTINVPTNAAQFNGSATITVVDATTFTYTAFEATAVVSAANVGSVYLTTQSATAVTGAADGTFYTNNASSTATAPTMITTTSPGVLKFVGNTRTIAIATEWNSSGTSNAAEFALTTGQIGSLTGSGVKFNPIVFSSGIITTDSFISASSGDVTIKTGATLISSRSTSGVIGNSSSAPCGTVTIESGGILELTGSLPTISCTNFVNNGTVNYSKPGTQTLLTASLISPQAGTTAFNDYNILILSNTSAKTLAANITIANGGKLFLQGSATLAAVNAVSYGTNATLEYDKLSTTTVGIEWPATNGPTNITCRTATGDIKFPNNSPTAILRTITGILTLNFVSNAADGLTIDDNSGAGGGTPNVMTFANGSSVVRISGTLKTSGGKYVWGTAPTDVINVIIAGTPLNNALELPTSTPSASVALNGKINLTINNGKTYSIIAGNRTVNNVVNNGVIVFAPAVSTIMTFTINGSISGPGTISGHPSANIAFTGALDGNIGTLNFTSGSGVVNDVTIGLTGTNSSLTLGTPVTTNGIGATVGAGSLLTGASLNLTSGSLIGSNNLTLGNGANISRSGGSLDSAPTFTTSVNVNYSGANAKTASFEIPSSSTVLNNLTNSTGIVTLNGATQVNGLLTLASGTIATGANNLTLVSAPVITSGTIDASNAGATVTFANSSAVVLPAAPLFTGNVQNLTINGIGGVTLGSATSLAGKLTLTSGLLTTGGLLTLKSGDCCTSATVAPVTGSISGNVIVERNIPLGKRAYRLLSPSTTGGTIKANWQENQLDGENLNAGFGTHLTGTGGDANGFDTTTNNAPSIFTHTNTGAPAAWTALVNTYGLLSAGSPYLVYIRGSRLGTNITSTTNDVTTLRTTGTLKTGTVNVAGLNTTANGFSLVGNPYQAQVDMGAVLGAATNLVTGFYYILEPKMGTKGTYVTVNSANGTNNSVGGSTANQYLQPGQACFVKTTTGTPTLSFQEANKFEGTQTSVFRKANTTSRLSLALYDTATLTQNGYPLDGVVVDFEASESNTVNQNDADKLTNFDENIATTNSSKLLSIESRAIPIDTDEIPLNITKYRGTAYTIKASGAGLTGSTPYLLDQFTSTTTEIPQDGSVNYAYTVDAAIPASIAADRFKLIYAKTLKTIDNASSSFALYPNPSKANSFNIVVPQSMSKASLTISNLLGQKLYSQNDLQSGTTVKVNVSNVKISGVYLVSLTSEGKTTTTKWIVE